MIEKLIYKRLYRFLDQNEILKNNQYNFKINHSTKHTLIYKTDKIRNDLDNKYYACFAFDDLEKAFNVMKHAIQI